MKWLILGTLSEFESLCQAIENERDINAPNRYAYPEIGVSGIAIPIIPEVEHLLTPAQLAALVSSLPEGFYETD